MRENSFIDMRRSSSGRTPRSVATAYGHGRVPGRAAVRWCRDTGGAGDAATAGHQRSKRRRPTSCSPDTSPRRCSIWSTRPPAATSWTCAGPAGDTSRPRPGDRDRRGPLAGAAAARGVHSLRAQRVSEIDSAAIAAEALQNRLIAATQNKQADDIVVLVGREAIVEARNELCDAATKEICTFDKPPYVQARPNATPETLRAASPEWQALERGSESALHLPPGIRRRSVGGAGAVRRSRRAVPDCAGADEDVPDRPVRSR